jgi:hypothetical protein
MLNHVRRADFAPQHYPKSDAAAERLRAALSNIILFAHRESIHAHCLHAFPDSLFMLSYLVYAIHVCVCGNVCITKANDDFGTNSTQVHAAWWISVHLKTSKAMHIGMKPDLA